MDLPIFASGDRIIDQNDSTKIAEQVEREIDVGDYELNDEQKLDKNRTEIFPRSAENNEAKLRERIEQCRNIIESLKLELNEEKTKLERDNKVSEFANTEPLPTEQVSTSKNLMEEFEKNTNLYSSSVDDKLNYDENLIEYEKQLQKYQNTLNMAQIEKKNAIRKQMLAKAYKLKLLEVENQCNIELLRVKQSLQCFEPLQMIANKWKTSNDDVIYDSNNFMLMPRYPDLGATSGSDVNSLKDDHDIAIAEKPENIDDNI